MLDFEYTRKSSSGTDIEDFPDTTLFEVVYDFEAVRLGWLGFKFSAAMAEGRKVFIIWFTHHHNGDGFEWDKIEADRKHLKVRALDSSEAIILRNKERK